VLLRPLDGRDADALVAAMKRADPMDLRRRFMGVPPPPSYLVRRLSRADGVHDLALGAFDSAGDLVGVAQFDRADDAPEAEVAIEIATGWQHAGLGTAMLHRLAGLARQRGIHEFTATYYADNVPIRRLLRDVGRVVESGYETGEGHLRLNLDDMPAAS
jgi:RimJ/RimL family protein N-acetyltransferase